MNQYKARWELKNLAKDKLLGKFGNVILLIITGTITNEDMALLPKGDKIAKKLEKFNLMK